MVLVPCIDTRDPRMHPPSISKPRPLANQMRAVALPTAVLVATALAWVCLHEAPAVRRILQDDTAMRNLQDMMRQMSCIDASLQVDLHACPTPVEWLQQAQSAFCGERSAGIRPGYLKPQFVQSLTTLAHNGDLGFAPLLTPQSGQNAHWDMPYVLSAAGKCACSSQLDMTHPAWNDAFGLLMYVTGVRPYNTLSWDPRAEWPWPTSSLDQAYVLTRRVVKQLLGSGALCSGDCQHGMADLFSYGLTLDLVELGLRLDGVSAPDFTPQSELTSLAQSAMSASLECICSYPIDDLFNAAAPLANVVFHALISDGRSLMNIFDTNVPSATASMLYGYMMTNYTSAFDSGMGTFGVFMRTGCTDRCKQATSLMTKLYMRIVHSGVDAFYNQIGMPFLPYSASLGYTTSDEVLDPFITDLINVRRPG